MESHKTDVAPTPSSIPARFLADLKAKLSSSKYEAIEQAIADQIASLNPTRVLLGLTESEQLEVISRSLENTGDPLLWNVTASTALKMMALEVGKPVSANTNTKKLGVVVPKAKAQRTRANAPDEAKRLLASSRPDVKYAKICKEGNCRICNEAFSTIALTQCVLFHRGTPQCHASGWYPHVGLGLEGTLRSVHRRKGVWTKSPTVDPSLTLAAVVPQQTADEIIAEISNVSLSFDQPQSPTYDPLSPAPPLGEETMDAEQSVESEQSPQHEEAPLPDPEDDTRPEFPPTLNQLKSAERRLREAGSKVVPSLTSLKRAMGSNRK